MVKNRRTFYASLNYRITYIAQIISLKKTQFVKSYTVHFLALPNKETLIAIYRVRALTKNLNFGVFWPLLLLLYTFL